MKTLREMTIVLAVFILMAPALAAAQDVLVLVEAAFRAHREGDFDKAIGLYSEVLKSQELTAKERAVGFLLRGEAYKDKDDCTNAVADFTRALKIDETYAQAYYFRGLCYEKLGEFEEAFEDVKQAGLLKPDKEAYRNRLEILKAKQPKEKSPPPE
jgi:tetratricopeptide (TPR) repeat protein